MKVFISSVTYMLKDERNALPPFLRLFDHEPLRFEDFTAQDRSAREACLAGVEAADVYVLLLGPTYGEPFPDTSLAPTHEEFRLARNRGIPILVFRKAVDVEPEARQSAFLDEVGHYVNGRFWRSFADPLALNQAVGEALKELGTSVGPLVLRRVEGHLDVPWMTRTGLVPEHPLSPVLELHLIPIGGRFVAATALAARAAALARDARTSGFVAEADPLSTGSDNSRAWAIRPPETSGGGWRSPNLDALRGLVATATGGAAAFMPLATDIFGALVNRASLQHDLAQLLALAAPHVEVGGDVALAVALAHSESVWEGDPGLVGSRSSSTMRTSSNVTITVEPTICVSSDALTRAAGEIAAELAIRLLNELKQVSSY